MRYPAVSSPVHACVRVHTYVNTHTCTHTLSLQPQPTPVSLGSEGSSGPQADQSPQSPPEVRQHIRPRDQNGKGGHLARLVSCGVSPTKSPRLQPRPLPSSHTPEVCVWRGGALLRRCPGAGTPCTKDCDSQSHRETQRDRSPGAGGFGKQGGGGGGGLGLWHPGRLN